MSTDNIRRDDWILGGLAILLVIALVAFPWFTVSYFGISASSTATGAPDGWLGILALIAALAVVADLGAERLSPQTQLPAIGGSREMTRFVLAAAAGGFVALKFLFHISSTFKYLGFGFPVDVVIAGALVFVALQARNAAPAAVPAPAAPTPAGPAGSAGPPVS
jgi:hypothetical protein